MQDIAGETHFSPVAPRVLRQDLHNWGREGEKRLVRISKAIKAGKSAHNPLRILHPRIFLPGLQVPPTPQVLNLYLSSLYSQLSVLTSKCSGESKSSKWTIRKTYQDLRVWEKPQT